MVYLVDAINSLDDENPNRVILLVSADTESNIGRLINNESIIRVKNNEYIVVKKLPDVLMNERTSVIVLTEFDPVS